MQTLNEIFSAFKLSKSDVIRLSNEAKISSIGCGKADINAQLPSEIWSTFDDISDKVWYSTMSSSQKIVLGFQLFEKFPSYYHFLTPFYHGIKNNEITDATDKETIWKQFMKYLAAENYYADPVAYVLWVDFFEDEKTVNETWQGLTSNYVEKKDLLNLLEAAGPVPYELKEPLYKNFISDIANHELIFKSLLFSAFDVYGQIDNGKALKIVAKLKIDRESEKYKLLIKKLK
jgi:hypothetical protein